MTVTAPNRTRRIVVGVDGSEPAARALRWALAEARRTGAEVEAVHAYEVPVYSGPSTERVMQWVREEAWARLHRAVTSAVGDRPEVPVHETIRRGPPGRALVRAAAHADLLVVGSRGHRPAVDLLIGSTAQHCASRALCPVVVLPPVGRLVVQDTGEHDRRLPAPADRDG